MSTVEMKSFFASGHLYNLHSSISDLFYECNTSYRPYEMAKIEGAKKNIKSMAKIKARVLRGRQLLQELNIFKEEPLKYFS